MNQQASHWISWGPSRSGIIPTPSRLPKRACSFASTDGVSSASPGSFDFFSKFSSGSVFNPVSFPELVSVHELIYETTAGS
jgi:hypothetical protein